MRKAYGFPSAASLNIWRLTPKKTCYVIKNSANAAQAFRSHTNLIANQLNQGFTATRTTAGSAQQEVEVSDASVLKQYFDLVRLIGG